MSRDAGQATVAAEESAGARYRMAELERLSGVGREAIRFYIRKGLLPEPERPSRTMAWYSAEHVRLLRTIRRLREDEFLPLAAIRAVLHDVASHPFSQRQQRMLRRMRQRVHREGGAARSSRGRAELAEALGLDREALRQAEQAGLIREDADDLSGEEEELLALWAEMRDAGLSRERGLGPRDMAMVARAVDQLFSAELDIFSQHLGDLSDAETDALLEVVIPNINRMFALLHGRRVRSFVESANAAGDESGEVD